MNRTQIEQWAGKIIYLTMWPFMGDGTVKTAEGKTYGPNYDISKQWLLLKLTKGGMAMITDGANTISVPPYVVNDRVTLR